MIERSLVGTDWLADRLRDPRLRVVDGSMYLPGSGRDAAADYAEAHVPGAVFFDVEASSDSGSPLPHMLPSAAEFADRMSTLGLSDADDVVVYDEGAIDVLTAPEAFADVKGAMEAAGFQAAIAEVAMRADNDVAVEGETAQQVAKLLRWLEDMDDVQAVHSNADLGDAAYA